MDKNSLIREIEHELKTVRGMSLDKKISYYNTLEKLKNSEDPKDSGAHSAYSSISQRSQLDLHELQMLQKELNYQKRLLSKEIRKRIKDIETRSSNP